MDKMVSILIISIVVSFLVTLFILPGWIKRARKIGLVWENMNRFGHPKNLVGSGGIAVLAGFTLGVLSYIAIKTFVLETDVTTVEIFALLTTVLISGIVGLTDDFLGWAHGGMSAKLRILLILFAAVPLMVINAGEAEVFIPFFGIANLGLFFPLVLIPLGVIGASTTFNFLAGFNGLEASQGILVLSALSFVTWKTRNNWLALITLCMVACLIAFYFFNRYPAKVLPGDTLTYSVGALIAVIAILGNIERIAVFFFIPYIIETGLKSRGRLKKQSFGKVNQDNSLEVPYEKFYGLTHVAIHFLKKIKKDGKVYERNVVWSINFFQIAIILIGIFIFKSSIF
jgi:UDP-N-acetylglucosamine--dolichyl-phosphate N-acetylglucosaminephosphotransferase